MLAALIILLAILWFFGYVNISGISFPDIHLFAINGVDVTLWNVLVLFLVVGAIYILPSPFRQIAGVLLILWILAVLGILSIAGLGLPSILLLAIIVGLVASLFTHRRVA
jgi:hypothetical protein